MRITLFFVMGLVLLCLPQVVLSQSSEVKNQIIRGFIIDRTTGQGIKNAYVQLLNHSPIITAISLDNGEFKLKNVPVGRQRIRVEAKGYYESIHSELVVAGKQSVITIGIDEELTTGIVVVESQGNKRKDKSRYRNSKTESADEMNAISVQTVKIEDITKYAGNYAESGRLITNFPGMFNINDTENYIVSRGNSPYGMQWMVEDVPIENPHHFARMGNTGAVFSLINNNLLGKSDFVNGALGAQYSNVYSGVFDIQLRRGNNQNYEFTAQLSTQGAEFIAEGPFKKKGASFAIAFKTGIFDLLQLLPIDLGSNSTPRYYDLNFKIDIPTKKAGHFSIFGIGGLSNIDILGENIDTSDLFAEYGIDYYVNAGIGLFGVKHKKFFDKRTSLKTTLSYLIEDWNTHRDTILVDQKIPYLNVRHFRQRIGLSSELNKKFTPQFVLRAGISAYGHFFNIVEDFLQTDEYRTYYKGFQVLANAFVQGQYKFSPRLTLVFGVQGMYWSLNKNSWAVEPRLALNWYLGRRHKLSLGYGWHSRILTFPVAFFTERRSNGSYHNPNLDLGPTRSHHLVLSYDLFLGKFWNLRTSVYGQYTNNLAVETTPSSLSIANFGATTEFPITTSGWQTTGDAVNYGIEFSLEKLFNQGYYGLLTASYQRSFYRGSDQIWRNSAFDVQYIATTAMGKEFKIGKKRRNVIYSDLRFNIHGGLPYTPIDLEASKLAGAEVLKMDQAFSERVEFYKRLDFRIGVRLNHRKKRISHHIYVEVINIANFKNEFLVRYNPRSQSIVRTKQFGILPNLYYQIRF